MNDRTQLATELTIDDVVSAIGVRHAAVPICLFTLATIRYEARHIVR